jgi:hypothetical protein
LGSSACARTNGPKLAAAEGLKCCPADETAVEAFSQIHNRSAGSDSLDVTGGGH